MSNVFYITEGIFTQEEINNEKSPLKAIKNYCRYNCCCNDFESWKECNNKSCFLWHLRFGKNPNSKRTITEEHKQKLLQGREKYKNTSNLPTDAF